jgi:3-methyladenine DNA glycosylase AlkD
VSAGEIRQRLKGLAQAGRAGMAARYFRAYPGGYGEGDVFLGISMPDLRSCAKACGLVNMETIRDLLGSHVHEERMLALLLLISSYEKGSPSEREDIFRFYLDNTRSINNWDLVDVSAPPIVGTHLLDGDKAVLSKLARSGSLWEKRIAMVSTLAFIRQGRLDHTFGLARLLLSDREDLMHKAVGWMLREAGKRDEGSLRAFLDEHGHAMPRTMLRYAIERFPSEIRAHYLAMGRKRTGEA